MNILADLFSLTYPLDTFILITLAFLFAGIIKGILGMGMPAILMVILTLMMPPLEAIPLILMPMLLINVFQFFRSPEPAVTARKFSVFAFFTFTVIILVAFNLKRYPEGFLLASIGIAMVLFAVPSLFGWRFTVGSSPLWQALGGTIAGIIGGLSSVWSPPVVMYLIGRNIGKDEFVGAVGYIFMVGSIGLGIALGSIHLLTAELFLPSMVGLGVSLLGFRIGEDLRRKINTEIFRKLILIAFLLMGSRLVLVSIF